MAVHGRITDAYQLGIIHISKGMFVVIIVIVIGLIVTHCCLILKLNWRG